MANAKERKRATKTKKSEKPSLRARFTFSDTDQSFEIDVFDLTAEEQIMVEEFFNRPWDQLLLDGWITGSRKGQVYAAFLARRRQEPSFTYQDAVSFEATESKEPDAGRPTSASRSAGSPG